MASENPEIYVVLVIVTKPETEKTSRRSAYSTPEEPEKFFKSFTTPECVINYVSHDMKSHLSVEKILKIDQHATTTHMTIVFKGKFQLVPILYTVSLDLLE
jgi:hypothetical protein